MRILVLSDKVLSRRLGDGLRVHGLLKPLAQKHQFDLICFSRGTEELDPDLRGIFQSVTLIPAPEQRRSPLLRRMFKSISAGNFKLTSEAMRKTVDEAIRTRNYDLILEEAANTVPNLPAGPLGAPLIVDSIDEPLLRELRALRHAPLLDRPEHLYRAWRFWLYERAMLTRASVNVYVSEVDAAIYTRCFPGRRTAVVPNGVDTEYFAPMQIDPDGSYVVFEGNMNFEPNVDTARVLVQEILPRLRRRVAHARIGLVGRNPTDAVRALASDQVDVTGTVEDVRPYLAKAAVFACPMRLGSGIKNKILQAWAMERPVVANISEPRRPKREGRSQYPCPGRPAGVCGRRGGTDVDPSVLHLRLLAGARWKHSTLWHHDAQSSNSNHYFAKLSMPFASTRSQAGIVEGEFVSPEVQQEKQDEAAIARCVRSVLYAPQTCIWARIFGPLTRRASQPAERRLRRLQLRTKRARPT